MSAFETATLSSAGGREDNEDSCGFVMKGNSGCWVIADGLGGHSGGKTASRLAVDTVLKSFESDSRVEAEVLSAHVHGANRAILEGQKSQPQVGSMRTTVVALAASPDRAVWIHSGDSRLYWFDAGRIRTQTRDHSVPQLLVDAGEIRADQIRTHEDRNRLLRCLGRKEDTGAVLDELPRSPQAGDAFLLASDGFWEWVTEAEMLETLALADSPGDWLKRMETDLRAHATGVYDNYSAIGVFIRERAS